MGLIRGLFVRKDGTRGTSPVEARKALAGLITPAGAFGARPGVLSGLTVTGTAGWAYSISPGHLVTSRSATDGIVLSANDGAATISTSPAPGTGGRIDLIWVRHGDVDLGDATSENVFGVTQGTVAASPVAPALPTGAMELARATVMAGAASTSAAGVTLTNTARRTGLRGGTVEVPSYAQLETMLGDAPDGLQAWVAAGAENGYYVRAAGEWRPVWTLASQDVAIITHPEYSVGLRHRAGVVTVWARGSNPLAAWVDWSPASVPSKYRPKGAGAEGSLRPTGNLPMGGFEVQTTGEVHIHHKSATPASNGWQASATYAI